MGPWAFYSPLFFGALLVLAMNEPIRGLMPRLPPATQWTVIAGVAVLAALQSQILMLGAQGAFAQVLPVPIGRSLRGRPAVVAGWLLILWVVLSATTALLAVEQVTTAAYVTGVIAIAALAVAAGIWIWGWPTAVADFGRDDYRSELD